MKKLIPTNKEVTAAKARLSALNPGIDYDAKNKEAIEKDGYKNEKCPKCKVTFLACVHFIICHNDGCPMKSKDGKSLLDMMKEKE